MKYTLLSIIQKVGSEIKSDEITELDETIEAIDIRNEVQNTFDDLMSTWEWEFLKHRPRQLDVSVLDAEAEPPTREVIRLALPPDVKHIEKLMYNATVSSGADPVFKNLQYLAPAEFHELVLKRKLDSNIEEYDVGDGVRVRVYNDREPSYFTSYDEASVVFDSYLKTEDADGIDPTKTAVIATITMVSGDGATWTPAVPEYIHNLWFQESVSRCSAQVRGVENARFERQARRAQISALRQDEAVAPSNSDDGVNYGR